MAIQLKQLFSQIANALRAKGIEENLIKASDFPNKILNIPQNNNNGVSIVFPYEREIEDYKLELLTQSLGQLVFSIKENLINISSDLSEEYFLPKSSIKITYSKDNSLLNWGTFSITQNGIELVLGQDYQLLEQGEQKILTFQINGNVVINFNLLEEGE